MRTRNRLKHVWIMPGSVGTPELRPRPSISRTCRLPLARTTSADRCGRAATGATGRAVRGAEIMALIILNWVFGALVCSLRE